MTRPCFRRSLPMSGCKRPDHIVVTGDIANIALPGEFPRGRDWLESTRFRARCDFRPRQPRHLCARGRARSPQGNGARICATTTAKAAFPSSGAAAISALIGLSTGVPTAPFLATGWLGTKQLAELAAILNKLKVEDLFRIILIHHPPNSDAGRHKRLLDAPILKRMIAAHGADLLLHGHDHRHMVNWLHGPNGTRVPAIGVPSASSAPGRERMGQATTFIRLTAYAEPGAATMISRGLDSAAQGRAAGQDQSDQLGPA